HRPAMTRVVIGILAILALPSPARSGEKSVSLTVAPAAAPRRALQYQLLPEISELNPGNAAHEYLKCFMEQYYFFFSKQAVAARGRSRGAPFNELPLRQVRDYGGGALRRADWAARMDSLDWQGLLAPQSAGLEAPPAEVGTMQVLAKALHVRFRGEVAEQRF